MKFSAFIVIWVALSFLLFLVEEIIFHLDTFLVLSFTTIVEGMADTTFETISIINSSETGRTYFGVQFGPLFNRIKANILGLSENDKISLMRGLLVFVV